MRSILKRVKPAIGFVLISMVFISCTQGPTDVTEEIRKANEEFMAAFDANDAARLTAVYSSDATLYPPNSEPIRGSEDIEGFWQAGFDMGLSSGKISTTKATAYGDTAIEEGTFEIYAADGSLIDKGKFIGIWKKVDGKWKFHNDIWNTSMPLPEPAPEPEMEQMAEESASEEAAE
jgi:ketosteroid isomerase-like protein